MSAWILFHIVCGVSALLSMFVPVFTKKGGRAHRLGGRVYVWSMAGVVASALTVCAIRLLDETADHEGAYFLALVGILAGANTWYGVRVLQQKTRQQAHRNPVDRSIALIAAIAGAAGTVYGFVASQPLFIAFGLLSVSLGVGQLREMAGPWKDNKAWLVSHLSNMLAACIATSTAFLVVNQPRLPAELAQLVPPIVIWLAPTVLGSPLIIWWSRKVRRGGARARQAARP